jgi:hypothetical protein
VTSLILTIILGIAIDRWLTAPQREARRNAVGMRVVRR